MKQIINNIILGLKICFGILGIMFVFAFFDASHERKSGVAYFDFEQKACKGYWQSVASLQQEQNEFLTNRSGNIAVAMPAPKSTHKVRRGETYYGIAKRYNTSVKALKRANGGRKLVAGETIPIN